MDATTCGGEDKIEIEDPTFPIYTEGTQEIPSHILHCSNRHLKIHFQKKVKDDIIPCCVNSKRFLPLTIDGVYQQDFNTDTVA